MSKKVDKLTDRREREKLRMEWIIQDREEGNLNTPILTEKKYEPNPTPKVFSESSKRKKQADKPKTIIIYQGLPVWFVILLILCIIALMGVIVMLISRGF